MKRFVLIFKILLPLFLLAAFFLPGCTLRTINSVEVSKGTVKVGEEARLSVRSVEDDNLGCSNSSYEVLSGDKFDWSIEPSNGATVKNGVFVASKPGTYVVSPKSGPNIKKEDIVEGGQEKVVTNTPVTIVVKGTEAEDTAAGTTAKEAITTTKPSKTTTEEKITTEEETNTESEETSAESETTSTETDANLIHGVVPTKVTGHGLFKLGWEFSFEFWNVGKLGGEQYAKATMKEVLTGDGAPNVTIILEGYFTGGPNGDMYLNGAYEGQSLAVHAKLAGGKTITLDEESSIPIDNPEAFNGWVD